jgi:type I restriction enzyme S subunit
MIGSIPCPLPPLDEQEQIANFLDRKTKQIDDLIAKKEALLAKLDEKRSAIISHAVTKGLDPTVPMKDSGVEWIGKIPEHWWIVAIKRCFDIRDGTHDTPPYIQESEASVPLITSKDFENESIDFIQAKYISLTDHKEISKRSKVDFGDVLMSMIGGNIGKSLIVQTHREFSIKNVALFKSHGNLKLSSLLLFYLSSGLLDIQISLKNRGGAQGFLSLSDIRNLIFLKIPNAECNIIVKYLDQKTSEIDLQKAKVQEAIERLKEYRTALITNAVTGKIDVRQVSLN